MTVGVIYFVKIMAPLEVLAIHHARAAIAQGCLLVDFGGY